MKKLKLNLKHLKIKKGIQAKLVISVSLIVISMTVAMNLGLNRAIKSIIKEESISRLNKQVGIIQLNLLDFQQDLENDIKFLANNDTVKNVDESITSYINSSEEVNMTPSKNGGIEQELYEIFKSYADLNNGTQYVYLATKYGGYVQWPEAPMKRTNYDPRVREWYTGPVANPDKVNVSDPYIDSSNNFVVNNTMAIKDANGEIVGVIGINVYDNKIAEILSNMKSYKDDRYILLDKSGTILVDSNNEYTSKSISDLGIEKLQTVLEQDNVDFNAKIGKDEYVIQSRKIQGLDRTLVSFIKEKSLYGLIDTINAIVLSLSLISLAVAFIAVIIISYRITHPIIKTSEALNEMASGNLKLEIDESILKGRDETSLLVESTKKLKDDMCYIIGGIKDLTRKLEDRSLNLEKLSLISSKTTEEVATAMENLATRTVNQADRASNIRNNLECIDASINNISGKINEVNNISVETKTNSLNALDEMDDLKRKKNESINKLIEFENVIEKIVTNANNAQNFTNSIQTISSQTNLLALNASIEAARAGEAGKSFAIVADEIRKLSNETEVATSDINNFIKEIKYNSKNSVLMMEEVKNVMKELEMAFKNSEDVFKNNIDSVNILSDNITSVLDESIKLNEVKDEMITSINKIVEGVEETSAITQEVTASAEEQTSMTKEVSGLSIDLSSLSENLKHAVNSFKI